MANTPTHRTFITDEGTDCPAFVAEAAFDSTPEDSTHVAEIGGTTIWMVVDEDGGVLSYDDGETIVRRVISDIDRAADTFEDTVDSTVEEYERHRLEFEFEYSSGAFTCEFETRGACRIRSSF